MDFSTKFFVYKFLFNPSKIFSGRQISFKIIKELYKNFLLFLHNRWCKHMSKKKKNLNYENKRRHVVLCPLFGTKTLTNRKYLWLITFNTIKYYLLLTKYFRSNRYHNLLYTFIQKCSFFILVCMFISFYSNRNEQIM